MLVFMPLLVLTTSFQLTLVIAPCHLRPRQFDLDGVWDIRFAYAYRSIAQICISLNNHDQLLDFLVLSSAYSLIFSSIAFCAFFVIETVKLIERVP